MAGRSRWAEDQGDGPDELHEINVTPFIDVMLVLLIIFMVAAPLATVNMPVDLPALGAPVMPQNDEPIAVTLGDDLGLSVEAAEIDRAALAATLDRISGGDRERRIFLRADRAVAYGEVTEILDLIRSAGYARIALVGMERRTEAGNTAGTVP